MKTSIKMLMVALGAAALMAGGCDLFGKEQPQPQQMYPGMPGQQAAPGMPMMPGQQAVPGMPMMPAQPALPAAPAAPQVAAPEPAPAPMPPMPTGDALTDRLNTAKFNRATDWKPTSAMERLPAAMGERRGWEVTLPGPPFCHTFIAAVEDGIEEFAMKVESATGEAEGEATWPTASLPGDTTRTAIIANHCPTIPGSYKVFFENRKGAGAFALQVFSKAN